MARPCLADDAHGGTESFQKIGGFRDTEIVEVQTQGMSRSKAAADSSLSREDAGRELPGPLANLERKPMCRAQTTTRIAEPRRRVLALFSIRGSGHAVRIK